MEKDSTNDKACEKPKRKNAIVGKSIFSASSIRVVIHKFSLC